MSCPEVGNNADGQAHDGSVERASSGDFLHHFLPHPHGMTLSVSMFSFDLSLYIFACRVMFYLEVELLGFCCSRRFLQVSPQLVNLTVFRQIPACQNNLRDKIVSLRDTRQL
jgi:hypothetical protein